MKRAVAILVAVVPWTTVGADDSRPPAPVVPEPGVYAGIRRTLVIHEPPPVDPKVLAEEAARTLKQPSQLAAMMRTPGTTVGYGIDGSYKPLGDALSITVGTAGKSDQATIALSSDVRVAAGSVQVAIDPQTRKIALTMSIGARRTPTELVEHVAKLELGYPDNRAFLTALGVDAGNIPGARSALALMQQTLGTGVSPIGPQPQRTSLDAALGELRTLVPPLFDAGARFQTAAMGTGYRVTQAGMTEPLPMVGPMGANAKVSVQHVEMERIERGSSVVTPYEETGLAVNFSAGAGRAEGSATFEIGRTTDPQVLTGPIDSDVEWAASMVEQGTWKVDEIRERAMSSVDTVLHPAEVEAITARADAMPAEATGELDGVARIDDPMVGGVSLRYDPEILAAQVPADEALHLLQQLNARLDQSGSFAVTLGAPRFSVVARSLRALAADATLGGLTRVRGYVVTADDVLVLGEVEPGQPAIDADYLVVALRAIWRDNGAPFISIDPDPADFLRPHRLRVGQLALDLEDTAFVETMVEADYAMKAINLGESKVSVPGFHTRIELQAAATPSDEEVISRFWLRPAAPRTTDLWEARAADGRTAVVFDSHIEVATARTSNDLVRDIGVDSIAAYAAQSMTEHYAEISRQEPWFARLQGLVDVAKLAAVLRARGVDHPVLATWAARTPRKVTVRREFPAIGPKMVGTTGMALVGGALSVGRVRKVAVNGNDALAPVLAAGVDAAPTEVRLPDVVDLAPQKAAEIDGEIQLERGMELWTFGRTDDAIKALSRAIDLDIDKPKALAYRALAHLDANDRAAARADLDAAVAGGERRIVALRGMVRALDGDSPAVRADLEAAEKEFPDDEAVLTWVAWGWIYAFDLARADAALARLLQLDPLDASALDLGTHLDLLYRLGPTRARARVNTLRTVPFAVQNALTEGSLALRRYDFDEARVQLERCMQLTQGQPDPYHANERCTIAAILAVTFEATIFDTLDPQHAAILRSSAQGAAAQLVQAHPDWPTPYLFASDNKNPDEAIKTYYRALANRNAADPILEDLAVQLGTDSVMGWYGLALWYGMSDKNGPASQELIGEIVKTLPPGGVAHRLWRAMHRAPTLPGMSALDEVREAEASVPTKLGTDAVDVWSVAYFYNAYVPIEQRVGDAERARVAALKFLAASRDLGVVSHQLLGQVAAMRFALLMGLGDAYKPLIADHAAVAAVVRQNESAAVAPDVAKAALAKARDEVIERERRARGDEAAVIARFHVASAVLDLETKLADASHETSTTPADVVAARASWRAELVSSRQARNLEPLIALADASHTPVEVRTLSVLLDGIRLTVQRPEVSGTEEGRRMADTLAKVSAHLRPTRAVAPARDWARWGGSGATRNRLRVALAAGGAVAVAAAALLVALALRRRRRSA